MSKQTMSIELNFNKLLFCFSLVLIALNKAKIIKCDQGSDHGVNESDQEGEVSPGSDPKYIQKELKHIFNLDIDKDKDGLASLEELRGYLNILNEKTIEHNVEKQWHMYSPQIHEVFSWEGYEPERKEVLTWEQYFNQTYPELSGIDVGIPLKQEQDTSKIVITSEESAEKSNEKKNEDEEKKNKESATSDEENEDPHLKMLKLMVHRANARWKLADDNGDTLLTRDEFKFLWHPEEGTLEIQELFVKEATEDMDTNKNSNIELNEFIKHLDEIATEAEKNDEHWLLSQKENFGNFLDKNKDGALDGDEIKQWLIPDKSKKFELEAKRLLEIGDLNQDSSLSESEFLEQHEHFSNLLPPEHWTVDDEPEYWKESDSETTHDEL